VVLGHLWTAVGAVLGGTPDTFATDRPLSHLGLDSLVAIELQKRLTALGCRLPLADLLRGPTLDLWLTVDGERTPLSTPALDDLAPGERVTFDIDLSLPRFSFGTHVVEGTINGAAEPVSLRAETSHIPWLLFVLPSIVLAQLALVWVRNRIRRGLHTDAARPVAPRAHHPAEITLSVDDDVDVDVDDDVDVDRLPELEPQREQPSDTEQAGGQAAAPGLAGFINATLDEALAGLDRWPEDDDRWLAALHQRSRATTAAVADRFAIPYAERPALAAQITRALLDRAASPRSVGR
jgi:aryl carrier-like protein